MGKTPIEWTQHVWNPARGCSMAKGSNSPEDGGCYNCYAARQEARNLPGHRSPTTGKSFAIVTNHGPRWTGELELIESQLTIPLHRRTPTTYFVNSMSDLFHEDLPDEAIDRVFAVMDVGYWHTYQILTKRGERLAEYVTRLTNERLRVWINRSVDGGDHRPGAYNLVSIAHRTRKEPHRSPGLPLPNVWLGVSCETQKCADERIPHLLRTPAAVRFVSLEPLLGPINLRYALPRTVVETYHGDPWREPGVDWVIVGGESGPGARPCETDWIRDILRQCKDAGVPCFVKQLGADPLLPPATPCRPTWTWRNTILHPPARRTLKLRDRKGGNMEEWPADLRVREMPRGATCANS